MAIAQLRKRNLLCVMKSKIFSLYLTQSMHIPYGCLVVKFGSSAYLLLSSSSVCLSCKCCYCVVVYYVFLRLAIIALRCACWLYLQCLYMYLHQSWILALIGHIHMFKGILYCSPYNVQILSAIFRS